jgi:hypothetical protein
VPRYLKLYYGTRGISSAKTSREFYRNRENRPIKFLESTNYYLLKLSRPVEILELLPRVRSIKDVVEAMLAPVWP